jgi:hypothetical protein
MPAGLIGVPTSFEVDGEQYIAVIASWGLDAQGVQNGGARQTGAATLPPARLPARRVAPNPSPRPLWSRAAAWPVRAVPQARGQPGLHIPHLSNLIFLRHRQANS